ncbi:MAG: hypothetical protein EP308_04075 [Burkholderiales bacterium]|nr:MAG: hypothetical protein EP308_04075 [Burkholderiales bacterium]
MRAVKKARKLIEANPTNSTAETLSRLVLALESETPFQLADLYKLGYADFELALAVIAEWRLDRYYTSKAVLLDLSMQVEKGKAQAATESPAATAKA